MQRQCIHVAGIIRFDGLMGLTPPPDCGKTCDVDCDDEEWTSCTVPCGSDGSLLIERIIEDFGDYAKWSYLFYGDLTDYVDWQEIVRYFNKIVIDNIVRQGCFTVNINEEKARMCVWDGGSSFIELCAPEK